MPRQRRARETHRGGESNPEKPGAPVRARRVRASSPDDAFGGKRPKETTDKMTLGNPVAPHTDPSKVDPMFTPEDRAAKDTGKGSRSQTKAGGVGGPGGKRAAQTRKEKSAREP